MFNLNGSISKSLVQPSQADPSAVKGNASITLKINGLQYLFDPSKQPLSSRPQSVVSAAGRPGLIAQTFFQFREDSSIGNSEEMTVYHIELNESESLDSEEEFAESLEDEEMDEKEEPEDPSFSDGKPAMQEGEGFNEEASKELIYEIALDDAFKDERARKMWQKAKLAIFESLQSSPKKRPILSMQVGTILYFPLLSKK